MAGEAPKTLGRQQRVIYGEIHKLVSNDKGNDLAHHVIQCNRAVGLCDCVVGAVRFLKDYCQPGSPCCRKVFHSEDRKETLMEQRGGESNSLA